MAGGFPVGYQGAPIIDFYLQALSAPIGVSASATVNTKGAWTDLIFATTFHGGALLVSIRPSTALNVYAVDIGIGSAGSEITIIPNIYVCGQASTKDMMFIVPIAIPAGSRVAARAQSSTASAALNMAAWVLPDTMGSFNANGAIDTYNMTIASATMVTNAIDPGATANTKGAYVSLASATTRDYRGFFLSVGPGSATTATISPPSATVDIAIGSAGNEKIILPDFPMVAATTSATITAWGTPLGAMIPIPIPAGSRVAARASCNRNTATGRLIGVAFHGVP